nr:MAG TPA: hypothetical protein [Bacteriophage sp.]
MSLCPPVASRRLRGLLRPLGGIFAPTSSRAGEMQNVKPQQRPFAGPQNGKYALRCPYYIPTHQNGPQRPAQRHTRHKATPAHSIGSKPGYCHLLWARDRTAQRSLSASHQAQREPGHKYISFKVIPPLARHPLISRGQNL